jgi:hypothetical protein
MDEVGVSPKVYYKAVKRVVDAVTGKVYLRPNMNSEEFDFKVGKTYYLPNADPPRVCENGFHACEHPAAILTGPFGYDFHDVLLEVELHGKLDTDGFKTAGEIMIVRAEISWKQAFETCGLTWKAPSPDKRQYSFDYEGRLHSYDGEPAASKGDLWQMWYDHGKIHRDDDMPAVIDNGKPGCQSYKKWYKHGRLHRCGDLPALVKIKTAGSSRQEWYVDGCLHRECDLPAVVVTLHAEKESREEWYKHGKLHRDGDKPARVWSLDGDVKWQSWYKEGLQHRDDDKPSWESEHLKEWYQHGQLHRDGDEPAVIMQPKFEGIGFAVEKIWYKRGQRHRDDDKPAVEKEGLTEEWYRYGVRHREGGQPALITSDEREWPWVKRKPGQRIMAWYVHGLLHRDGDLPAFDGGEGEQKWYRNGLEHRDGDKPACITESGCRWYKNGQLHRDGDGPAVMEWKKLFWYKNGRLHRDGDKPAVVDPAVDLEKWFSYGQLHRGGDKPAVVSKLMSMKEWHLRGTRHRDGDRPAVVEDGGRREWWYHGKMHRDGDMPAYEGNDRLEWHENGKRLKTTFLGKKATSW